MTNAKRLILAAALAGAGLCGPAAGATDYVPNSMCAHAEPIDLPELLKASDGSRITTVAAWEKRRGELLDYFTRNVYGVRPVERPSDLRFEPIGADVEFPEIPAVRKRVRLSFSGPRGAWSFVACAFLPKGASPERPVPAFLLICNRDLAQFADIDRKVKSGFFPVEEIVRRGYAAVVFKNTELALDEYRPTWGADGTAAILDPDFRKGFYACWAEARTETSWGAISAWAWGASRVLDWLETLPAVDAKRVAVIGHSRGGKTSLWAAASDSRFAMACVNDSGAGGARMNRMRLPDAENIAIVNIHNPHWFTVGWQRMNYREDEWGLDTHDLAALVAPRLLAIGSASEDSGAGPVGEFATAKYGSLAWEKYGLAGIRDRSFPAPGEVVANGNVSYHLRVGKHDLTLWDWNRYMDFADAHGWSHR